MTIPTYLYHYYELENGPFRNITEQGMEQAHTIQSNITEGWNNKRPHNYLELRFALEERIKKEFVTKGGVPNRNDPFYFTLGECEWAKSWYVHPGVIKIPLANFDSKHISFTYPDSMVSFQLYDEPKLDIYRKKCNGQLFFLDELPSLINEYGLPSEEKWESEEKMKYDRYIEAQVWDATEIKKFKSIP